MISADPEALRLTQAAGAALAQRDFAGARQLAQQLLLRSPGNAHAFVVLGFVALELGDRAAAGRHIRAASKNAPNDANVLNASGVALRRLGEADEARGAFARAGELGLIDGWRNLGILETSAGNGDASIAAYQRGLALAPNDVASHAALAQRYEARHDLVRAKAHATRALAGDPGDEIARIALAQTLMREKDFAGAEAAVGPVTQSTRATATNRALAWGLVGEARDRRGDANDAFAAFTASNQILREQNAALLGATDALFHPAGVAQMAALAAGADVSAWRPSAPSATSAPVFLVGFPRSGTTLLDQILSSHSGIVCIEEEDHFAEAMAGVISDSAKLARFAEMADAEIDAARADYWRRVRAGREIGAGVLVVDKLPLNIVLLPLIKRVFPDAKIILALRDPRDVVLSCYQQRFGMNAAMVQFLELNSAARYYDAVMGMMETCRARLDLPLHQVRYEDVVADVEAAARGLAAFLGVAFEPGMLGFRETALKRDIQTPSARQVIEPIYNRSVERWRRYEEQLAPVLPLLNAWAARYGYAA